MERVQIGTKVHRLGIQRLSVGEGSKCRAVLLDPNPCMKHIAYDEVRQRRVEVNQDMCIKYGLRPSPTFFYLVAKLNTDLNGNIIGDQFTVEYLQLSETLNNEFSDQVMEQGVPKSLSLTKVKKTANGKDFSYIKVTPSGVDITDNKSLSSKINELRNNAQFIEKCWQMIDSVTSMTGEAYVKLLESEGTQPKAFEAPKERAALPQENPMPQVPESFTSQNDFASEGFDDDFNSGF